MSGRRPAIDIETVRKLRELVAIPRGRRPYSVEQAAARLGINYHTAKRAAYRRGYYGKVQ